MALDTRIPLMTKGIDGVSVYKDGLELADTWLKRQTNAELDKIKTQTLDIADPNARFDTMVNLAKQSKRAKWLIDELNAEKSAGEQAQLQNQKSLADINKTISEQSKNNAQASKFMTETGKMRIDMSRPIYEILAMTGSTQIANNYLNRLLQIGQMDENEYRSFQDEFKSWSDSGLTPDEIKVMGMSYAKSMLSPEYLHQTANNQADNNRAIENSIRDNLTQRITNADDNQTELEKAKLNAQVDMYAQDVKREENQQQAIINARRLAFQKQQAEFQKNKPVEYVTNQNGELVAVFANGSGQVVIGEDGNPIKKMQEAKQTQAGKNTKNIADLQGENDNIDMSIAALRKALEISEKGIYDGYFAETRANLMGNFRGGTEESRRTQEYQNIITTQALQSLKSVFSGNPTEGERAILIAIQASADKPPEVRKAIIENAIEVANARKQSNLKQMSIMGGGGQITNPLGKQEQKHGRVNPNSAFF